ncbi:protein Dok-7-like isoform X2 [Xyrichtys novacula]|uniref:Protein Dok-7-like isoform X2 n=1 Tax=Xyrichtys novacula TaxID=13765 RepID=A0AAV1EY57_XYRNO|nr:protein Dok-7-like isoform X2 [Xyrichtys novacula]
MERLFKIRLPTKSHKIPSRGLWSWGPTCRLYMGPGIPGDTPADAAARNHDRMTDSVVAEGQVKFRDGKKWKTRWVVLRKPSPVADCLYLLVYKEKKKGKEKSHKERLNVTLEGICGVEPGTGYDGVSYILSILCLTHTLVLGFNSRDALSAWDSRVCYSLGEVHRLSVNVEPGTKLESGPASFHLCNNLLVLARGVPPVVIGHWKLSALRRYGAVPNGFVFEGGTRCGYWAGVFFLSCSEGEHISFLFDCIVRGITPTRAPCGVGSVLPGSKSDPESAEKRISQETSELEKRLSMLSNCSLASSTASTYSCSTSVAGDDQSSISSSSSSQSDTSYGSRFLYWAEPRPHPSNQTPSSPPTMKALTLSDDRLYGAASSSAQLHPRGLHDSGRQSSLDSGIGIATGSQSCYSGSSSSYTGSLDIACPEGEEEYGSVMSLPASPPPPLLPPPPPLPLPPTTPPPPSESTQEHCPCASRSSVCASRRNGEEYQTPSLIGLHYDTPRNVLHTASTTFQEVPPELGRDSRNSRDGGGGRLRQRTSNSPTRPRAWHQTIMQHLHSWGSERAPSVDGEKSAPRPELDNEGFVCEETKSQCCHGADNYITPEQWRSVKNRCVTQTANIPQGLPTAADAKEGNEDAGDAGNYLVGLRRSAPLSPPSAPPSLPGVQSMHSQTTSSSGMFQSAREAHSSVSLDTGLHSNRTVNYVNLPISPLTAKSNVELLFTELNLQEHSSAQVFSGYSAVRGKSLQLCRPSNNP